MKRPGDDTPEPPGGRAAERLRDQVEGRWPQGLPEESLPMPAEEVEKRKPEDGEACREKNDV
ncbi:MAG TPA: hypothetical protein VGQ36_01600 [Thermoanaerobaculia bacterium]|nr:hypothetical protein [Thermoanaerobaculia bacterium]